VIRRPRVLAAVGVASLLAGALLLAACGAEPTGAPMATPGTTATPTAAVPTTAVPTTAVPTTAVPTTAGGPAASAVSVPTRAQADSLLGRTPEAARASGYVVRAVRIDGVAQMGTTDYRPERINVAVAGGVITEIVGLG